MRWIVEAVAHYYGLPPNTITGILRQKTVLHARFIAIFLAQHWTGASISDLATWFKRDRSTIRNAISHVQDDTNLAVDAKIIHDSLSSLQIAAVCKAFFGDKFQGENQ